MHQEAGATLQRGFQYSGLLMMMNVTLIKCSSYLPVITVLPYLSWLLFMKAVETSFRSVLDVTSVK